MGTNQSGFTLIEMVFVIVIVSILSSVAIPKFADVSSHARKAVMKQTYTAVRTSVEYTRSLYFLQRDRKETIRLVSANVSVVRGYPDAVSIIEAAGISDQDFVIMVDDNSATIYPAGIPLSNDCSIKYYTPYTDGFITNPPEIKLETKGC
jgi:MSHA pilin protein MshA